MNLIPDYKEVYSKYQIFVFGENLNPIYIGNVGDFKLAVQRDKAPVFTLGNTKSIGITRKGRLTQGTFTRFLGKDLKDTQELLLDQYDKTNFPKVYTLLDQQQFEITDFELLAKTINEQKGYLDADGEIMEGFNSKAFSDTDIQATDISGTTVKKIALPPLRLGDFAGLDLVLVGIPETSNSGNTSPSKAFYLLLKNVRFVGEAINISIDNPNIIEQISFYAQDFNMQIEPKNIA